MLRGALAIALAGMATTAPRAARADGLEVSIEAPFAVPISWPQLDWFKPGVMPAVSLMRSRGALHYGARLRAGVLLDGPAPDEGLRDYRAGGLGALEVAVRLQPFGERSKLWLDLGAGAGVTGSLVRPVAEIGIGWTGGRGATRVSPVIRYLQVQGGVSSPIRAGSARMALVGLEVSFGRAARPRLPVAAPEVVIPTPRPTPRPRPRPQVAKIDPCKRPGGWKQCPNADFDGDGIVNALDACPEHAEVINEIDDGDGCPDRGIIEVVNDRVVLDAEVLFDWERARVKSRARKVLRAVIQMWKAHPEWDGMIVEGHTCSLGSDEYNDRLSQERARNVRRFLLRGGLPAEKVKARGYGRSRPLVAGTSEAALARNRRVEIVILAHRERVRGVRIGDGELAHEGASR